MEEFTQITLDEWMQWKEDIRQKLKETAGNFVYIGCRLRQIRDSGMLDGAEDIFEFAQKEYGLSKSTTSRFIAVNERFADPYNPLLIRTEFENIGSSKLSEMLTLPDAECMLITEKTTVKEIRDLKAFNREAEKLETETESAIEPVATSQQNTENELNFTPLQKCIIKFFKDKQGMVSKALEFLASESVKEAYETVNPAGQASCMEGICFLFLYDWNRGVSYKLMTTKEVANMTAPEFMEEVKKIYGHLEWNEIYKKQNETTKVEPEKEETATFEGKTDTATPVQQSEEIPKDEPQEEMGREQDKAQENEESESIPETEQSTEQTLHDVEPSIPEPDPIPEAEHVNEEDVEVIETQIPGQDTVENHSEWMPDEQQSEEELNAAVSEELEALNDFWNGQYNRKAELMLGILREMQGNLEKLEKFEEVEQ